MKENQYYFNISEMFNKSNTNFIGYFSNHRKKYNLNSDKEETSQEEWIKGYNKWEGKTKKERCPHN